MADVNSKSCLLQPRPKVSDNIKRQIELGIRLRDREITSSRELNEARAERERWVGYTSELLIQSFDGTTFTETFRRASVSRLNRTQAPLLAQIQRFREEIRRKIDNLQGVLERLPLIPEGSSSFDQGTSIASDGSNNRVFIVHGHDLTTKNVLARFIQRLRLEPIILDEQPSQGRTIIEKFEHFGNTAGFAVVLLTPDDVIVPQNQTNDELMQARPNVLFELGYFVGKLGRGRVCLLRKGPTDIPSDLFGIVYVSLDRSNWQVDLAKEMRAAGLNIDLNNLT